jgi:hypothetical protein
MDIIRFLLLTGLVLGTPILSKSSESDEAHNLKASVLPDKRSVSLVWRAPETKGEIIIARSNNVIDTEEKLFNADSLGRYPSDTTMQNYDYNLSPGTYYYAVVLVESVKAKTLKLKPDQNYTTKPIIISNFAGNSSPQNNDPSFGVDHTEMNSLNDKFIETLVAKKEGQNLRLEWIHPPGIEPGKTIYTVYKSKKPMSSLPFMREAQKLAELGYPEKTFLDQDPELNGTSYYGVSVKEDETEHLPLFLNKSFIRVTFVKDAKKNDYRFVVESEDPGITMDPLSPDAKALSVDGIRLTEKDRGVVLQWNAPAEANEYTDYSIYASKNPPKGGINTFLEGSVVKLGTVTHPKTSLFINKINEKDTVYFGVTARSNDAPENFNLKENSSFISYKQKASPQKENTIAASPSKVEQTPPPKKSIDQIIREEMEGNPIPMPYNGYDPKRSKSKPQKFDPNNDQFEASQEYDQSSGPKKSLDSILRLHSSDGRYDKSLKDLNDYVNQETDPVLKGKAYLYAGIGFYRMGNYKKALSLFQRNETKLYSDERSEFWTNKTIEQIGKGGNR